MLFAAAICCSPQARLPFTARILSNSRASFSGAAPAAAVRGETTAPEEAATASSAHARAPPPPSMTAAQSTVQTTSDTRIRALSLYRQILRGAERMPTPNRQNYIKRKTRSEYRRHATLTDPEEIDFQLRLADTNLDTVMVQAEHLSRLFSDPEYQNYN
mmetsp:Transcript_22519/g.54444  ORF Transcript_22519/g.54444 Transcript_22519/m.54444 type:complete len:159 (+) Transcript_22519:116-592(+)